MSKAAPTNHQPSFDQYRASLLGGAIGDMFGAPVEGLRKLTDILSKHGTHGLQEPAYYDSSWLDGAAGGLGVVTDDTTMTAATLVAIGQNDKPNLHALWQAYLLWGAQQLDGENLTRHLDGSFAAPNELAPFLFRTGAGTGTIAALQQGLMGTLSQRLTYDCEIRGKKMQGPNAGCGGMMRVAPAAFFYNTPQAVFAAGNEIAAITHGDDNAIYASGAVAVIIHVAAVTGSISAALNSADTMLQSVNATALRQAFAAALLAATADIAAAPTDFTTIDDLPKSLGYKNPFLAVPVWAQTIYVLARYEAAQKTTAQKAPLTESFKNALRLAANHSGDSDSVASIVGQVLGAAHGSQTLPTDWLDTLQQRPELETLIHRFAPQLKS